MQVYTWRRLTLINIQWKIKKTCKNNSVLRKEKESEPKRDCSVEETEAISASFLLAEGLCHPPVKAQTKQINRQTVWSTDCGWSSKICRWDKRQVHALIAQQCYPEALGCLAAAGQRGAGRSPHDSLCPAARKVSFAHSFLSPHSKQRHGIFPSARPRITLLITGLRRAQGWGTPQPSLMCLTDQKHRLWGRHMLCWTEAWADGPGVVVQ